jgi:PEP-CTERM motif
MSRAQARLAISAALIGLLPAAPAIADTTFFSTGGPDENIATASRPDTAGFEIESADDFVLTKKTSITDATFTGLIPTGASPTKVVVEIYRVFPNDSDGRRMPKVPTRANSPSDVEFADRDSSSGLTFSTTLKSPSFTVANSVQPGGISVGAMGDGLVTREEVEFDVTFADPFLLPADHYFFVPQVQLDTGDFLWLSAAKPIDATGIPFPVGFPDLQSWTRDAALEPDWLRVGTDIVGPPPTGGAAPTFNAAFSLSGAVVPEPSTWAMMLLGFAGLGFAGYRRARMARPASA